MNMYVYDLIFSKTCPKQTFATKQVAKIGSIWSPLLSETSESIFVIVSPTYHYLPEPIPVHDHQDLHSLFTRFHTLLPRPS
jgi:hypothetical protein